jgi:hypothetical protein
MHATKNLHSRWREFFLVLWITHRFERHILGTRTSDPTVIQKFKLIGVLRRFTNICESACDGERWSAMASVRTPSPPLHADSRTVREIALHRILLI